MTKIKLGKKILSACTGIFTLVILMLANNVFADSSLSQGPNNASSIIYDASNGGTILRTNPMNAQTMNDIGATATLNYINQVSKYLRFDTFGFTLPTNATIVGIGVNITRKISYADPSICTASINDSRIKIIKNGVVNNSYNPTNSTPWTTGYTTLSYGGSTTLWGLSWTPADINNANFGVVLAAKSNTNCNVTLDVDTANITVYYTVPDTTPPTCTSFTYTPASGPVNTDVIATCNPSEPVTFQNPAGTNNYTFTENGSYVFEFTDSDGNTGSATAIVTWIDKIAPVLTETTPVPSPTNDNTPNYTFNSTEAGTITYGGSCSSTNTIAVVGNNTISFNTLVDGTYSDCTILVTDYAGNQSNILAVNTFVIDTVIPDITPPTCTSFTYIPASGPVNTDVIAICNPSEPVTFQSPVGTGSYTFTGNGSYLFEFTDSDGNTGSATATVTWIDKVGPVLNLPGTLTIETASSATGASVSFDVTANDLVDGPTLVSCIPNSGSFFPLGTNIVVCSSSDSAGNTTTGSFSIIVAITPAPPGGGGGGGGGGLSKDYCPNGDNSPSYYDGTCEGTVVKDYCPNGDLSPSQYDGTCEGTVVKDYCPNGDLSPSVYDGTCEGTVVKDYCPNGDLSPSVYDGTCEGTIASTKYISTIYKFDYCQNNIGGYAQELIDAYRFAFKNGITTAATIGEANMTGYILRSTMAKIISQFAINVLNKVPDTSKVCAFTDITGETKESQGYIQSACQLGLMGVQTDGITPKTIFDPQQEVTIGEFGTIVSRLLYGSKNNGSLPFYTQHLAMLKADGIMTRITKPFDKQIHGYAMLALMRAFITITDIPLDDKNYSQEANAAYRFAFAKELTTAATIGEANMTGHILRATMAKMISEFAINILHKVPDTSKVCTFTDTTGETKESQGYIQSACQLGLMGVQTDGITPQDIFAPQQEVTRDELGTIVSRLLYGNIYNGGSPYYKKHLYALTHNAIMTMTEQATSKATQGDVFTLLMNASQKDYCPNGDNSPSFYDCFCGKSQSSEPVSSGSSEPSVVVDDSYSQEYNDAYGFAFENGMITINDIKQCYDIKNTLTRSTMAKMMVIYATKVLSKQADTTKPCIFNDISGQTNETQGYIKLSCQLGLMGMQMDGISQKDSFNPNQKVTRAEFGTAFSRALWGDKYNGGEPYYTKHLDALKAAAIMTKIDAPFNKEILEYVLLMMMRAK